MTESIKNIFDLTNKTALVTGCSRGIGKAIAIGLAQAGCDIVGVSSSNVIEQKDLADTITNLGKSFTYYQIDLSSNQDLTEKIAAIHHTHSKIDILINNAGIIRRAPAALHSDEFWDEVINVNLRSSFILARSFGSKMIERGSGKIIFIASLLSFQGGITVPSYAASKGAVASLIKALSNEWASQGVNVNGIAPGYIATNNTTALREDHTRSTQILARIPAGRWGEAEDLVGGAIFLASQASNYVNGEILTIDGGWMGR
jgi:2-dehydro-3-deoxy-D-gluconate 5-dehydrogenase